VKPIPFIEDDDVKHDDDEHPPDILAAGISIALMLLAIVLAFVVGDR
jgi:hypothetical protein